MKISKKLNSEIFYKNGTMKKAYKKAILCFDDKGLGRPVSWISRRNLEDLTGDALFLLRELGLKSKTGNDSSRGGQEGNYIKVSARAVIKLKRLLILENV